MKFHIKKQLLDETLEIVTKYSDPINSLYGFRCILIKVENEKITFSASNGVINIIKSLDVDDVNIKIEETGMFLIQANIFKNVIKKLSGMITLNQEFSTRLEISQRNSNYKLTTNPISSFPEIEENINLKKIEIDTNEFRKAIKSTIFAVSQDSSLVYKCINFKFKDNKLNLTATDAARLSYYSMNLNNYQYSNEEFSVNSKDVKDLIPADAPKKITFFFNRIKMGIEYKNTVITSRIVDLPYPDIESLFTSMDIENKLFIKKEEINDLINKVWLGTSDKQNRLEFTINKSEISVLNKLDEISISVAKTQNFKFEGKAFEFDINYHFLKDALSVFEGDVLILFDKNIQKILIASDSNKESKQLVTPMRR
ncbi:DNA polymerase III subunit beta [Mycoplasmopsis caviae]|uniref:DNA polymerase III subunit beta n=1 Tax=Mycoplasmopsis caviae TaxID=55603 RepID=A0A3P8LI30_9BACT|nr:DNA polymerase III subunit beta [Mycoplasmopsis caviae]UUD35254.1 DNA polymerase III subunit beta [Mycoplasmopsis caviae]VDR41962.1 DNA polymerase III, beta subunit [Mycoplasmopsis caviae]